MARVRSLDRAADAWERRSRASTPDYEEGVKNPRRDWADETAAAENNYNTGVQSAISRGAFGSGVRAAGTNKWQKRALTIGKARWAEGVRASMEAYKTGFAPYRNVLENLDLPERGPKGDPANIDRVRAVTEALHNEKLRQQGG